MIATPFFGIPCCYYMSNYRYNQKFLPKNIKWNPFPLHADLLFIFGYISRKQAPLLQQIYYLMPKKSLIIHVIGHENAFINSYGIIKNIEQILPIDITINKCPLTKDILIKELI